MQIRATCARPLGDTGRGPVASFARTPHCHADYQSGPALPRWAIATPLRLPKALEDGRAHNSTAWRVVKHSVILRTNYASLHTALCPFATYVERALDMLDQRSANAEQADVETGHPRRTGSHDCGDGSRLRNASHHERVARDLYDVGLRQFINGVLTRIEPVLRVINLPNVVACPFAKRQDGLAERLSKFRQCVLHLWRTAGKDGSRHDSIAFQCAQGPRKHLLRDPFDAALNVVEPARARLE